MSFGSGTPRTSGGNGRRIKDAAERELPERRGEVFCTKKVPGSPVFDRNGRPKSSVGNIASVSSCQIIGRRFDHGNILAGRALRGESFPARRSGTFALKPPIACGTSPAEVDIAIS